MDTELLKTFLEVSRTRHFGRAAESLYLTQSAVSFRIRQLENQLGVNLFTRHRNNIRLTAAGEKLLPYAETLMSTWQAARKEVAHTSRHNEFSIGASASSWARKKGGLHTVVDSTTLSRPLYAIWLQNSDKNALIRDLLKINVLDEVY